MKNIPAIWMAAILFLIFSNRLYSATKTSTASGGTWATGSTWVGGVAPASSDNVIIVAGATVTLGASATITGSLTVSGTLRLVSFSMTSGDLQGTGTVSSSMGTPTLTTGSNNASTTFSGVIGTGAIALVKNGTGTLTLGGNNSYTGATTISAGILKLNHTSALGSIAGQTSVTSGAVLDLNGLNYASNEKVTLNGTGISTGGAIINSSTTPATYPGDIALGSTAPRITANNPITLSGIISGATDLTTAGTSTLTLSGTNINTGLNVLVSGSTLILQNYTALGSAASSAYTVINGGATLDLKGINYSSAEFFRFGSASGTATLMNSSAATATLAGKIDIYGTFEIRTDNPVIVSAQIASSSSGYTKTGSSTLTVTSANTWGYPITVSAGTLITGSTTALGNSSSNPVTVNSGAVLDLNGFSNAVVRILTLNGTGISGSGALINSSFTAATYSSNITLGSATSIISDKGYMTLSGTIAGAGYALTLSGITGGEVSNVISGASSVTKEGAGTWILSGLSTYTGTTTLSAGRLRVSNNTVVASTNGPLGNNASGLFLNGGILESNVATFSRPITITATSSGLDAYGSARTISSVITDLTAGSYFNLNAGGNTVAGAEGQDLTLSGVISNSAGSLTLTKTGTSILTLSGANTFSGGIVLDDGQLNLNHSTAPGTGALTINSGVIDNTSTGAITLTNNNNQKWDSDFTFVGTHPLNMGTGTVTMSNSRQVNVAAGTLTVGGTIYQNTMSLTKVGGGTLSFVSQPITLLALKIHAGTVTSTSGELVLDGSFTNFGTFNDAGGIVLFEGTNPASIPSSVTFNNLRIAKTGGSSSEITIYANINVKQTLTMTSGDVNLNSHTLTIGTSAAAPGTLDYTAGQLYGGTVTRWCSATALTLGDESRGLFPIGSGTGSFRPAWIGWSSGLASGGSVSITHDPNLPVDNIPASHSDPTWSGGTTVQAVSRSSWGVTTANGFLLSGATGMIRYGGEGYGSFALTDLNASFLTSVAGTFAPATNVVTDLEVNRSGLSTAQLTDTWRIGTKDSSVSSLPITLLSFIVRCEDQAKVIEWSSATEYKNDYFTIERSLDGQQWQVFDTVDGAGTSIQYHTYSITDPEPWVGTIYYRLILTDFDKARTDFATIMSETCGDSPEVSIYPNPSAGNFNLILKSGERVLSTDVFNSHGASVWQSGNFPSSIDLSNQPDGIYYVSIRFPNQTVRKRVLILK